MHIDLTSIGSITFARKSPPSYPAARYSAKVRSAHSRSFASLKANFASAAPRAKPIAMPSPFEDPVTSATLPSRRKFGA